MQDRKTRLYAAIAIGIGIVAGFCMGELVLRAFTPVWLQQRMEFLNAGKDPDNFGTDREWKFESREGKFVKFTPNSAFDVQHAEYSLRANIDELGGRKTGIPKSSESSRLLPFVGDSMTFGLGVKDDKTFTSYFSEKLKDQARVVNLGVPGTALHNQLFIVSARHAELGSPKVYVFFFFLGNDFNDMVEATPYWRENVASGGETAPVPGHGSSRAAASTISKLNALLFHNGAAKRSYLVQFVRASILRAYLRGRASSVEPVFMMMDRDNLAYLDNARKALREALAQLRKLEASDGFAAILVAIPDRYQAMEPLRIAQAQYYGLNATRLDPWLPNRILEEEAKSAYVPLIDSSSCMASRAGKQNLYFVNDNHFRESGHAAFYDCISGPLLSWLHSNM